MNAYYVSFRFKLYHSACPPHTMQHHTQYQHYIPQFILRNFSHPYWPPKNKGPRKNDGPRPKKGIMRGQKVLNIVDLASDEPQVREVPVSRWFGQENMYSNAENAIKSHKNIEVELSKLESRTAIILQKVSKAQASGELGLWLDRSERDLLRKFLFIMKYRGPGFFGKYFAGDPQSYQWDDKNLLRWYMEEHGFTDPRDVWLHNLQGILDLKMDAEGKWKMKLPEMIFPTDAQMFIHHVQSSYTAFCTPREADDEFILTDQCYNLMEGPICETNNAVTGEDLGAMYLTFHEFGPVSPKLIIVLRSFVLPEMVEDANPEIKTFRETILQTAAVQFPYPERVKSVLADLPVAKATNSYSRIVNGRLEPEPGMAEKPARSDKFCFRFWPIERRHVNIINSIFLDNILYCNSLAFCSTPSFTRTLEAYMTSNVHGFKRVGVGELHAKIGRRECLQKLSLLLRTLGSDITPCWHENEGARTPSATRSLDDTWIKMMSVLFKKVGGHSPDHNSAAFFSTYNTLGTKPKTKNPFRLLANRLR